MSASGGDVVVPKYGEGKDTCCGWVCVVTAGCRLVVFVWGGCWLCSALMSCTHPVRSTFDVEPAFFVPPRRGSGGGGGGSGRRGFTKERRAWCASHYGSLFLETRPCLALPRLRVAGGCRRRGQRGDDLFNYRGHHGSNPTPTNPCASSSGSSCGVSEVSMFRWGCRWQVEFSSTVEGGCSDDAPYSSIVAQSTRRVARCEVYCRGASRCIFWVCLVVPRSVVCFCGSG